MTLEEYEARALPRLALIDSLDKRCEWGKWDWECSLEVRKLRDRRERLMQEQAADEKAAGL